MRIFSDLILLLHSLSFSVCGEKLPRLFIGKQQHATAGSHRVGVELLRTLKLASSR